MLFVYGFVIGILMCALVYIWVHRTRCGDISLGNVIMFELGWYDNTQVRLLRGELLFVLGYLLDYDCRLYVTEELRAALVSAAYGGNNSRLCELLRAVLVTALTVQSYVMYGDMSRAINYAFGYGVIVRCVYVVNRGY